MPIREVSRSDSSREIDEGPNRLRNASESFRNPIGQLRRKTATDRKRGTDSRVVCLGGYGQSGANGKQDTTEPPDT